MLIIPVWKDTWEPANKAMHLHHRLKMHSLSLLLFFRSPFSTRCLSLFSARPLYCFLLHALNLKQDGRKAHVFISIVMQLTYLFKRTWHVSGGSRAAAVRVFMLLLLMNSGESTLFLFCCSYYMGI
jgi:hypothetical protein